MKLAVLFLFLLKCTSVFALTESFSAEIHLSPAGSFKVEANRIKGKILIKDGKLEAKNIHILVKNLKTGINLRDEHLQKKLGIEKDNKTSITLVSASGVDGKGKGLFEILGKSQEAEFMYKINSTKQATAEFSLSLKAFGISGVSYMGIGVQDEVKVKITMNVKD